VDESGMNQETEIKITCPVHGDYLGKRITLPLDGGIIETKCPQCSVDDKNNLSKEIERAEWQDKRINATKNFNDFSLPPRFAKKDFDSYSPNCKGSERALTVCRKYADNFETRKSSGGGLVLCGNAGTGKTHLVSAIINQIESSRFTSVFMSAMGATRHVKATYSRDHKRSESEAIYDFNRPDLLVLDEVGVQFGTDAEKLILFEIINLRYQHVLPTILISNLTLDELEVYIGERVIDRMHEGGGAVLSFDWDSYRRT